MSASSIPGEPVAAFADPALTTTARILARSMARLRRTGADGRALVVSTIAETTGPSAARIPRSSAPEAFSPQATRARGADAPAAAEPTRRPRVVTGTHPVVAADRGKCPIEQALGLGPARHQVEVLERLAGGALAEVVDGAEGRAAAARVGDGADLGVVGSLHGAHARRGLHDLHEGVIGIVGGVEVAQVVGVGRGAVAQARVAGGQGRGPPARDAA